ncbi:hypothetical protein N5923_23380 [Erwiniaceae bacterium BAC15a-03b]|uniref:Uncharacterized protein n=1 Tax=Winslowiella arboricola TaxID=2978220 RepID=A0A9J6PUV0_9GAMM|nr:hypothetical protein [Winslowiella arboricola]MCU5775108.1 hypothetical protein [Winslowiella arboricola]MCU5780438.1 hypothetical protein [Winslowiella arboricola]
MSGESIGINEVYEIAREKFPEGHLKVEIWELGLRFVWESELKSGSAFLQEPLNKISASTILGFLHAELKEPNYSDRDSTH